MTEENYIEERPMDVKPENASAEKSEKPEKNGTPVTEESPRQDEETPSLQEAIKEQAREDEAAQSSTFTLRRILGGDFLTTQMLRRQIGVNYPEPAFREYSGNAALAGSARSGYSHKHFDILLRACLESLHTRPACIFSAIFCQNPR